MNLQECFIGKDCSDDIRNAHILSKKATMDLIHGPNEKEQRKVVLIGHQDSSDLWEPKEFGWKKASTHKCFCGKHDNDLFEEIENENLFDSSNKKHLFLQSLRSFAYTYHKKRQEIKPFTDLTEITESMMDGIGDMFKKLFEMDDVFDKERKKTDGIKASARLNFYPYEETRKDLIEMLESSNVDGMKYITLVKKERYPFASAGSLIAEIVDTEGTNMSIVYYDKKEPVVRKASLMLSVMPTKKEETIIVLSAMRNDHNGMMNLKRFADFNSVEEFERAITSLMLTANKENTFLNPVFWNHLKSIGKSDLVIKEINHDRGLDLNNKEPHLSEINFFASEFSCRSLGV